MKLVDKMILFNQFLRENKNHKFDIDEELQRHKDYFKKQSKYWRDKYLYESIDETLDNLIKLSQIYRQSIDKINKNTDELLRKQELIVLRRDYDDYASRVRNLKLVQERANLNKDLIKEITADIGYYSDWRYAGVELNPSTGIHTASMLACDPLYLYTGNITDTDSIKSKFNNFFAHKRIMFYDNLTNLPQNQLGLATSINCYEFLPIDPIKDEIRSVYNMLRPGGYFIFTYNDCEQEASLDFLNGPGAYRTYNTKTLMTSMIQMLGFDIIKQECWRESHSWMVVKKPGDLTSKKLSGPLVKITDKI